MSETMWDDHKRALGTGVDNSAGPGHSSANADDEKSHTAPAAAAAFGSATAVDSALLTLLSHRFMSIAEQAARTLQRTAISINVRERLDFSAALFDREGDLVCNAPNIPVHLGAMPASIKYQLDLYKVQQRTWKEGDVVLRQFAHGRRQPSAGHDRHHAAVLARCTHRLCGQPRSPSRRRQVRLPARCRTTAETLADEGIAIESFLLVSNDKMDEAGIRAILTRSSGPGCPGTRRLDDNLSDLRAQVASNQCSIRLMHELIREYGCDVVCSYMGHLQANAERAVRDKIRQLSERFRTVQAVDYMDDGSEIHLKVKLESNGDIEFDFTGTTAEVYANHNAPKAVTLSAIIYCLRCLIAEDIPLNQGLSEADEASRAAHRQPAEPRQDRRRPWLATC